MFNDKYGLTKSVLDGSKTITRRIANPTYRTTYCIRNWNKIIDDAQFISKYNINDIVAIAQSYQDAGYHDDEREIPLITSTSGWTNKMFVCADLMPHHIEITNIRLERLQDISDEDCLKEGIKIFNPNPNFKKYIVEGMGYWRSFGCINFDTPREAYASLIDKISGKGTWESNPYVFVYEFKLKD